MLPVDSLRAAHVKDLRFVWCDHSQMYDSAACAKISTDSRGTSVDVSCSRQERPADNDLIRAYGVKADVSNGADNATFDMFPIGPTAFPPLFSGTTADPCKWWEYDHVFAQAGVCLNEGAMFVPCSPPPDPNYPPWDCTLPTGTTYQHSMADDYTWAAADGSYFYFAWCDRSNSSLFGSNSRPDPNIRFTRIYP